jgi:DNA-binding MarR family transcriptional regulator
LTSAAPIRGEGFYSIRMRASYSLWRYYSSMRKPFGRPSAAREEAVQAVMEALDALWADGVKEVPDWVAQELTFGQMRLLYLLSTHGPSPMSRVAEWLSVGLPSASGVVDRVERHGFVARRHREDDRRIVECQLTDKGRDLIAEIGGLRREAVHQMLAVLSDEELAQMSQLIRTVRERTFEREGGSKQSIAR